MKRPRSFTATPPLGAQMKGDGYLKEIQGLRILAALLVAVYHIWFQRVSGAVDAFFVIAGFFVFRTMFKSGLPGWNTVLGFYRHTVARIVPSTSIVILGTCLGFIWLDVTGQWNAQIKSAIAALFFVENWWLAVTSTDYLARDELPSPFQQMWALSVQVQMYLLLPLLLLGVAAVQRRLRLPDRIRHGGLAGIMLLSFIYALVTTAINQPFAYFDTVARLWQFLAGALLASVLGVLTLSQVQARMLGYVCLLVLMGFAAVVPVANTFPGVAALVPVSATLGVIVAAANQANLRVLTHPVMQRLGNLSFTFYLWHWPLLVGYWLASGGVDVDLWVGLAIILGALCLAYVTYYYAEQPFRAAAGAQQSSLRAYLLCVLVLVPAFGVTGGWGLHYLSEKRSAMQALAAYRPGDRPAQMVPALIVAKQDLPNAYEQGCIQRSGSAALVECSYGAPDGAVRIVLVGGSHSAHWLPALQEIVQQTPNLQIINITKGNCPLTLSDADLALADPIVCLAWSQRAIARIHEIAPKAVITLLSTTRQQTMRAESIPDGFLQSWEALAPIPVVAIRDTPRAKIDIVDCVDRLGPQAPACSIVRADVLRTNLLDDLILPPNVMPVDLSAAFCDATLCPPVLNEILVYRDKTHMTATFARSLTGDLQHQLQMYGILPIAR